MEEMDLSNDPVTFKFCDERSRNILEAIKGVSSNIERIANTLEAASKEQGDKLDKLFADVVRMEQQIDNGVLGRDFSNKRAVLVVSGILVIITLLSNLDKIANLWR